MHITKCTDYSLRVLMLLAVQDDDRPLGIVEISKTFQISRNHLSEGRQQSRTARPRRLVARSRRRHQARCELDLNFQRTTDAFLAELDKYSLANLVARKNELLPQSNG